MDPAYPLTGRATRYYSLAMRLASIGASDVGRKRLHNEDAFLVMPESGLFCVADGLGGHASGEVASRMAIEEIAAFFRATDSDPADGAHEDRVAEAIRLANLSVLTRARAEPDLTGMGTTLVAGYFAEGGPLVVAHVGDSRAYLFRGGDLKRLTEDHSLLQDFIRHSSPSAAEIDAFPHKNVIVRAVGMRDAVEMDLSRVKVREGDVLLLCSDGLFGMLPDTQMAEILREEGGDILRANQLLVDAANEAGGSDNITSVLVQVVEA
jgi:serine/threonine protein phosphatase PrpC